MRKRWFMGRDERFIRKLFKERYGDDQDIWSWHIIRTILREKIEENQELRKRIDVLEAAIMKLCG